MMTLVRGMKDKESGARSESLGGARTQNKGPNGSAWKSGEGVRSH